MQIHKYKKLVHVFLFCSLCLLFMGCSAQKSMSITLNVDTGDSISMSLDTTDGHKIEFDKEKSIVNLCAKDGKEESIVARGIFVPKESYALYFDTAYTDSRCIVLEEGKGNGIAYTFYSYQDGEKTNYEYIGWVVGTNTGVVMESTVLGKEDSFSLFQKVSAEAKKTEQPNVDYVYEPIVEDKDGNLDAKGSEDGNAGDAESPESQEESGDYPVEGTEEGNHTEDYDWTSMELKIDGITYGFPYSYEKLKSNGWTFNVEDYLEGDDEKYLLEEGEYTYSTTRLQNEKYGKEDDSACIYAGFKNYSKETKDIIDCDIWAMEISCVYGNKKTEKCPDVELPCGVRLGATYDEIVQKYGEPKEELRKDGYIQMDYDNDYNEHMTLFVYETEDAKGLLDVEFRQYQ